MQNPFTDSRPRGYFVGAVILIMVGLLIGLGLSAGLQPTHSSIGTSAVLAANTPPITSTLESPFVSVVDKTLPAVVFIDVRKRISSGDDNDPQEEMFRRFFGD